MSKVMRIDAVGSMHSFGAVFACEQGAADRSVQVRVMIDTSKTRHLKPDHIKDIARMHFESAIEELVYQKIVLPKQMSEIRLKEVEARG